MTPVEQIDNYISEFSDWRGDILSKLRKIVLASNPEINEVWKWDCPVWTSNGLVCAMCAFKDHVKLNFFRGVELGPNKLFNSGLDAKKTRSIDFREGDEIDEGLLKKLINDAVDLNI